MNTTTLRRHFIITLSTRFGYRQSLRFHLAEPINFHALPEDDKFELLRYAIESYGLPLEDINPDGPVEFMAFSTEAECTRVYAEVRGDKPGPAPRMGDS